MLAPWLHIQVELECGAGIQCDPPPGRIFLVGPGHSFLALAESIDAAFARWDVAHLHAFELEDGRLVGTPDDDPRDAARPWLDHETLMVAQELARGDEFTYIFDLSEQWQHTCLVVEEVVDPLASHGVRPSRPAIVRGWGWIPDQYGNLSANEAELS